MAFSHDGKRVASSDGDVRGQSNYRSSGKEAGGSVKVWDTETGKELLTIPGLPHGILRLKFSPDGKKLAGTPGDRSIKVWDAWSGGELYGLGPTPVNEIAQTFAFSPTEGV